MPRKKTAADRARARERAKIEAEQLTGRSDLTHRQVADVLRAHRNGDDPLSALSTSGTQRAPTSSSRSSRRGTSAVALPDHLVPVVELDDDMEPIMIDGYEAIPVGAFAASVNDFKMLRGGTCALSVTTSPDYRRLILDLVLMSRHSPLVVCAYEIPRSVIFGDPDDVADEWELADDGELADNEPE